MKDLMILELVVYSRSLVGRRLLYTMLIWNCENEAFLAFSFASNWSEGYCFYVVDDIIIKSKNTFVMIALIGHVVPLLVVLFYIMKTST
jgi:hypothetical protein